MDRFPAAARRGGRTSATIALALIAIVAMYFLGRAQGQRAAHAPSATLVAADASTAAIAHLPASGAQHRAGASSGAAHALPAARTPLKYVFADLKARADAGDAAAATRLYRDLDLCHRIGRLDRDNTKLSDELLGQGVDRMDPQQLANYRAQLDAVESREQNMRGLRALCDGVGADMLDYRMPGLRRAAQLGEPYARACYLDRGPGLDPAGLVDHPERLAAYRSDAKEMIEQGIAEGDWRVIDLLRRANEPSAASPLTAVIGDDPYQRYRYLKLYRLGAPSEQVVLDRDIAALSAKLTSAQNAQADAWAMKTFNGNFRGRSVDADGGLWDTCVFPYDGGA